MLFILDPKQNTIGVANSSPSALPYFDDIHTENLEGVHTYEFSVPSNHPDAKIIEVEGHVIVRNLDGEHLLFTIKEVSDGMTDGKKIKNVFCEDTAITELLSDIQRPLKLTSTTLANAVNSVLSNTVGWTVGKVAFGESRDIEFTDYMTVLEALRFLVSEYLMEMYFTVELSGTKIVAKKLNIVKERGMNTGVRFDYGYDLRGVGRNEDSSRLATAIIGIGKGDSASKRINLVTFPPFNDGDLFKQENADWIGSDSALQRWGRDGKHRFGIFVDDHAATQDELARRTINELKDRSVPIITYSSAISTLERLTGYEAKRIRLGDTVVINDKSYEPPIVINGRIKELKRSYTQNDNDSVDLGSYKKIALTASKEIIALQKIISLKEEKWNEGLNETEVDAKITPVSEIAGSANTKIDNLKLGGRNLIIGTKGYTQVAAGSKTFTASDDMGSLIRNSDIVFSFKAKSTGYVKGVTNSYIGLEIEVSYSDNTKQWLSHKIEDVLPTNSDWIIYSTTLKIQDKEIAKIVPYFVARDYTGTVYAKEFQIELGTKVTDYRPAIEDVDTDISNAVTYKVELHSSNGMQFSGGTINSTLSCIVYKGKENITSTIPTNKFIWKKFNENGELDQVWTDAHSNVGSWIEIGTSDVDKKATFICDVIQ